MQLPIQITYRDFQPAPAVDALIREKAAELDRYHHRIMSCRVVVETHHHHQRKGRLYHLRIDLTVPGAEIVVGREPGARHAHEDIGVAIRDAFDAARRQLEDHARKARGDTKTHAVPSHGHVSQLIAENDYGFIETPDGSEVYFHRNSVGGPGFDALWLGAEVRFDLVEGEGEKGPQASVVVPSGKHHLTPKETA